MVTDAGEHRISFAEVFKNVSYSMGPNLCSVAFKSPALLRREQQPTQAIGYFCCGSEGGVPVFNHLVVSVSMKIVLFTTLKQEFCASRKEM